METQKMYFQPFDIFKVAVALCENSFDFVTIIQIK